MILITGTEAKMCLLLKVITLWKDVNLDGDINIFLLMVKAKDKGN